MSRRDTILNLQLAFSCVLIISGIIVANLPTAATPEHRNDSATKGSFQFQPLLTSAPCTSGGNPSQPLKHTQNEAPFDWHRQSKKLAERQAVQRQPGALLLPLLN